ncbi:hypothetical protein [Psittacicella hinzii]|uniref:Outer membrane protein beta-barrel domain-containing protein n=1 Tax=Psittacicella hinzii TaxID=2028575 RepID=A0A3A1YQI8_9GAMM|nr:hypothetical protein [Psittacicella hinzii]RIY40442.1 hypothetical protein CKF58_00640 [Psittacicella hinzii]
MYDLQAGYKFDRYAQEKFKGFTVCGAALFKIAGDDVATLYVGPEFFYSYTKYKYDFNSVGQTFTANYNVKFSQQDFQLGVKARSYLFPTTNVRPFFGLSVGFLSHSDAKIKVDMSASQYGLTLNQKADYRASSNDLYFNVELGVDVYKFTLSVRYLHTKLEYKFAGGDLSTGKLPSNQYSVLLGYSF